MYVLLSGCQGKKDIRFECQHSIVLNESAQYTSFLFQKSRSPVSTRHLLTPDCFSPFAFNLKYNFYVSSSINVVSIQFWGRQFELPEPCTQARELNARHPAAQFPYKYMLPYPCIR